MFDLTTIIKLNYAKRDGTIDRKAFLRDTRETRALNRKLSRKKRTINKVLISGGHKYV